MQANIVVLVDEQGHSFLRFFLGSWAARTNALIFKDAVKAFELAVALRIINTILFLLQLQPSTAIRLCRNNPTNGQICDGWALGLIASEPYLQPTLTGGVVGGA